MSAKNNIYIITGGPGFGKTSVIEELRKRSLNGSGELSRQFIKEQLEGDGKLLPWVDRLGYSAEMLKRRVRQYEDTPESELWFFDRGIPDLIAYILKDGLQVPEMYYEAAREYRYNQKVFVTPPWEEIHKNDTERLESFEQAKVIHEAITTTYGELGYECVELPKVSINERVEFVLGVVGRE